MNTSIANTRRVARVVRGQPASDGAGVKLTRVIGQPALDMLDPFLLLDEFRSDEAGDYLAGFPSHPHRGFETVTYMLAGRMRHGDNQGNSGLLVPGSVQWMTAGRGIVHSEMPEQENGLMAGFQLWVNLPAKDKMTAPRYQDIAPERVPVVDAGDGLRVRVLAGRFGDTVGPVEGIAVAPLYLDVELAPHAHGLAHVPDGHAAFAYVFEGDAAFGAGDASRAITCGELAVFERSGDAIEFAAREHGARFILVAGKPLGESVARHGPFVMNTPEQIVEAIRDYQAGAF